MPKFSVITPVYNAEQFLRECLDSIRAQTNSDWECICVDDGSSDSSLKILTDYKNMDPRFRVIRQDNAGPGVARNTALDAAKGEWILFVDADDVIAPYMMATVLEIGSDVDIVRMGLKRFPADHDFISELLGDATCTYSKALFDEISYIFYMDGWQQFAYRRELIGSTRLRPYIVGEDIVFKLEYFAKARTISYTDRLVYGYRTNEGSITHRKFSYQILHDNLCWRGDAYLAMKASGKNIEKRILAQESFYWGQLCPVRSCRLPAPEADELLTEWYALLPSFAKMQGVSLHWRFYFALLLLLPHSRFVVSVFCCWPYSMRRSLVCLFKLFCSR